jgi:hypothetical protein
MAKAILLLCFLSGIACGDGLAPQLPLDAATPAEPLPPAEPPVPLTGWSTTAPMMQGRLHSASVLLPSGEVLLVGGLDDRNLNSLSTAEIFDPMTETWRPAPSMRSARSFFASTTLADGRVLIIGGRDGQTLHANAEVFDPAQNAWAPAGDLEQGRTDAGAVTLPDGRVIITGGCAADARLASVEIYEPDVGRFRRVASMAKARDDHVALGLADGSVVVIGGRGDAGAPLSGVERYEPALDRWSAMPSLLARQDHAGVVLPSGEIFVMGGGPDESLDYQGPAPPQLFEPGLARWRDLGTPSGEEPNERAYVRSTATLLADGRVLAVSGRSSTLYDPRSGTWANAGALHEYFLFFSAVRLADGRVLVTGGLAPRAAIFDPSARPRT